MRNLLFTPYEPYIHRGRDGGHRNYPSYDRGYDRHRAHFRQRSYNKNRREYSSDLEVVTIIQEGHTEENTIIKIDMIVDNKGLEVNPHHQLEDLQLYQDLPVEIKADVSVVENLVIVPKIILRRTPFKQSVAQRRKT